MSPISRVKSVDFGCRTIKIVKFYYFYKHCGMARVKLRYIIGMSRAKKQLSRICSIKPQFKSTYEL